MTGNKEMSKWMGGGGASVMYTSLKRQQEIQIDILKKEATNLD